jgi:Zn-dependent protease with chaperone function
MIVRASLAAALAVAAWSDAAAQGQRDWDKSIQQPQSYEPPKMPDVKPGERPPLDSDEAGLWMQMDRIEGQLRGSGRVVQDPALNAYVRSIVCRLAAEHCADIRIYLVQTPHFNATMAPNGVMQVWTGLLLRAGNEAQLAYVLGHELGHYLRRHSLQRLLDVKNKGNALAFFSLLAAGAGVGFVGDLAQLATLYSLYAYNRDQEREADQVGFDLMAAAGYAPVEAARVWEGLEEEQRRQKDERPTVFFSTHPSVEERIGALKKRAAELGGKGDDEAERYAESVGPHRAAWLREDLRLRRFAASEALLDRLTAGRASGELRFFQGELYRQRREAGDDERAIGAYREALELGGAPPEAHRSLGLALWGKQDNAGAAAAFRAYLAARPEADDRAMVEDYIARLQ